MISPEKIPSYTGDLAELQHEVSRLRQAAREIRGHGHAVHARFQHLDASYKAPEAEQLFATTQAVNDTSGDVADKLESVADALAGYADEVAVIVQRLETLRQKASAFVASVKDDQDPITGGWRHDQDKVDEHQALLDGVTTAVAAFQHAEVAAADKITALVHGTQWHINDGSPKQKNAYGFSADQLAEAPSLPWGSPEHYWGTPFGIDYHLQELGISLWDNAVGSVEGMVNLFSSGEEGDATRESLGKIFLGMESYVLDPGGDRDDVNANWRRIHVPYRKDAKEFAKSFVAWDDWSTNPGKAAGTVLFNGLTMASGPLGAASKAGSAAGKAGAAARVAGTLAKVGEVMDPIGAAGKTVGVAARALPKLSEVTAGLRAATDAAAAADTPHSVIDLGNGAKVRIEDGQFFSSKDGQPNTVPVPHESPAGQRTPSVDAPRPEESPPHHELVGAVARAHEGTAHAGESLPPQASHDAPTPDRGSHGSQAPAHEPPSSGAGADGGRPGHAGAGHHGWPEGQSGNTHDGSDTAPPHGDETRPPHGDGHGGNHGALPSEGQAPLDGTPPSEGPPPEIDPAKYSKNPGDFSQAHTGSIEPHQEPGVVTELERARMEPGDREKVLRVLRKDPYGSGVAEMISRGHLRDAEGYGKILDMCKQGPSKANPKGMVPAAYMAMRHATDLQSHGVTRVGFELDTDTLDLDVYTQHPDGTFDYGYQLKDVDTIKGIRSAAKKAASQLETDEVAHRVGILDVHQPMGDLTPNMFREAEFAARRIGGTFLLRFTDGSVTVPPNVPIFP